MPSQSLKTTPVFMPLIAPYFSTVRNLYASL
nr:MAG TPA: hypothetical protein [Caudoviricetes sp.]